MKLANLGESTDYNYKLIRHLVEYISSEIPKIIPEDEITYIKLSMHSLNQYFLKNVSDEELRNEMLNVIESLNSISLINKKSSLNNSMMGYLKSEGRLKSIAINVSGLTGDYNEKSKEDILSYRGTKSINNFKSILGHEIRHAVQSLDYTDNLPSPNDQGYNYHTDPLEIDASFMEALLDVDIDGYDDINQYTNDVFDSFKTKKPLSDKVKNFYYRKIAKFFTLYKQGDTNALTLKNRLEKHKKKIYKEFINGLDSSVKMINDDFNERIKNDYEKLGSIPKDDRQSYYINIPKYDAQRAMITKIFNGELTNISDKNAHLLVSTIEYANSISNIPNYKRVIEKIYRASESNISHIDTIEYISEYGYFNKDSKYLEPMLDSLEAK